MAAVLCDVELWRDSQPKELHAVDRECKRFRFVSRFVRIELVLSPLLYFVAALNDTSDLLNGS